MALSNAEKQRRKRAKQRTLRAAVPELELPAPPPPAWPAEASRPVLELPAPPPPAPPALEAPVVSPGPTSAAGAPLPLPVEEGDTKAVAAATVAELRAVLRQLRTNGGSPRELASLAGALTAATRLLSRLDGTLEITESMLVRSDAWDPLKRDIVAALTPWPDALDALIEALERGAVRRERELELERGAPGDSS